MEDWTIGPTPRLRTFEMPQTPVFFEYENGDPKNIILDGEPQYSGTYVKPSPFSQWTIKALQDEINLEALESIEVEMLCSVTPCEGDHGVTGKRRRIS